MVKTTKYFLIQLLLSLNLEPNLLNNWRGSAHVEIHRFHLLETETCKKLNIPPNSKFRPSKNLNKFEQNKWRTSRI